MHNAIHAEGLRKRYGEQEALRGVDLSVPAGTVLGVLGPNGAGKTTTVRILATLLTADDGTAAVAGFDVRRDPKEVRRRIGLTGQYAALDEQLTGRENLRLIGTLHHLGRRAARTAAAELLERFDLVAAADRAVKGYSGGMRRRLDLAASLMADPEVLFLDEPTTGLDPHSRIALWQTIRRQVAGGVTVLLTTQYLDEADQLADRIIVVDNGRIIAEGSPDELKRKIGGERLRVVVDATEHVVPVAEALHRLGGEAPVIADDRLSVQVTLTAGLGAIAEAATMLDRLGVPVTDFGVSRPSLDDVFLSLTGEPTTQSPGEARVLDGAGI